MQETAHTPVKDAAPTGTQTLLRGLGVVQAVAAGARDLKEIARRIGGSLCNVTRGARLMRRKDCASAALMGRLERGCEANNG